MVAKVEMVLFDLGGVLVRFGGLSAVRSLMAGRASTEDATHRWLTSHWVRRFESGRCSAEHFASGMVEEWQLTVGPDTFLEVFRSSALGPLPGAEQLVRDVSVQVPAGCLSNTNALHCDELAASWPLVELLDPRFLSFELGLLKPDREIFEHVVSAVGLPPEQIFFLDDNAANVAQARSVGFAAVQVSGVDHARAVLRAGQVIS